MKIINEALYDYNDVQARSNFLSDTDKILNAFHFTWLGILCVHTTVRKSSYLVKFYKDNPNTKLNNIDEDSNDLSYSLKLVADLGDVNSTVADKMIRFTEKLKRDPNLVIDESSVRAWFDSTSKIKNPPNLLLKKLRDEFVAGKTLAQITLDLWQLMKKFKKDLVTTRSYALLRHYTYNPPKGTVFDQSLPSAVTQTVTSAQAAKGSSSCACSCRTYYSSTSSDFCFR